MHMTKNKSLMQCTDMLSTDVIYRSTSTFTAPVLLIKKSNGSWHFYIDYRALNSHTVKDKFPILVVEELLDELRGALFFMKLDLCSGYHLVQMHTDDFDTTAFHAHEGLF
jgi:hypothetical protein